MGTLPSTVNTLGHGVFDGCSLLTSVRLPKMISTLHAGTFGNCASLTSVHLPENLYAISFDTFQGCSKLSIINAPFFSTNLLKNNISDRLKIMLTNAGFLPTNPCGISQNDMYYDWKRWARTKDGDGRLPLFTAAATSTKWSRTRQIFNLNMTVINDIDVLTGLSLFMLAAAGPTSDIESIYNLLREYPSRMMLTSNMR